MAFVAAAVEGDECGDQRLGLGHQAGLVPSKDLGAVPADVPEFVLDVVVGFLEHVKESLSISSV